VRVEEVDAVRCRGPVLVLVLVLTGLIAAPAAADTAGGATWVWPVAGPPVVARAFAPPATRYGPGHRGADVVAAVSAPVRAAGAGRVSYAGLLAGRGVVVVVHGDLRSTYEPVTASVRVGELVAAGDPLGRLAAGGHCTGCLHWGLLRGEVYLDPVQLVERGPSRLLPVEGRAPAPEPGDAAAVGRTAGATPPVVPSEPVPLRPPSDAGFSLRAASAPWAATAVVALLAGLTLLRRPAPRPPRHPEPVGLRSPRQVPAVERAGQMVDLTAERSRRRVV
jgi:murein DD-endopeptidase MepM/ murein hydrolase activator NlpD